MTAKTLLLGDFVTVKYLQPVLSYLIDLMILGMSRTTGNSVERMNELGYHFTHNRTAMIRF